MPTPAEIKAFINTNIRLKTAANSINTDTMADELDRLVDFAEQGATIQTLADGTTITMNVANGKWGKVTLGGNRILAFSGLMAGDAGLIYVLQPSTGTTTHQIVSFPAGSKLPDGGIQIASGASAETILGYVYDGTKISFSVEKYSPDITFTADGTIVIAPDVTILSLMIKGTVTLSAFKVGTGSGLDDIISEQEVIEDGEWKAFNIMYKAATLKTWYVGGISGTVQVQLIKN